MQEVMIQEVLDVFSDIIIFIKLLVVVVMVFFDVFNREEVFDERVVNFENYLGKFGVMVEKVVVVGIVNKLIVEGIQVLVKMV